MVAVTFNNTAGNEVATVPAMSVDTTSAAIDLIGQGVSLYGEYLQENMLHMLEHFADTTAPSPAMTGMIWHNTSSDKNRPYYYDGSTWIAIAGATTSGSYLFPRLAGATNINFAIEAATAIFTAPGTTEKFHPTGIMLIPNGTPTTTDPATFNLYISSSEDVMDNVIVSSVAANKHAFFSIEGATRFASGTDSIYLDVTVPVSSGTLSFDAYLFGMVRV